MANRFSSSRFSDVILADKILLISSCSDQRSSTDMASRLVFFMTHCCLVQVSKLTVGRRTRLVPYYRPIKQKVGQPDPAIPRIGHTKVILKTTMMPPPCILPMRCVDTSQQ